MVLELNWLQWMIALATAFSIGLTKTGIPGLSILFIPLMAEYFPAKASTGIVLPLLMFADVFAVAYYRRHAVWPCLLRLMPWTALGVVIGFVAMERIDDSQLKPIIGAIILVILVVNFWFENSGRGDLFVSQNWWFAVGTGVAAGVTTMMANAAGTIVSIYFLTMKIPKTEFIGTGAWYFFLLNWFKVPFSASLNLITAESLQLDFMVFPAVAVGAVAGIVFLKRIPEKKFRVFVQALAAIAAIKLLHYVRTS
ncbi:sulfite exporter TauE/SafE family protein [Candidatus Bathyarchaeota archaeon]|nr:sulfite exporter TauE/SafE family protein [Candidatus Bathyarchaeota archaeon]